MLPNKKYFYAGNTGVLSGSSIQFCGTWVESYFKDPLQIMDEIVAYKREELQQDAVVLMAFNRIT